MKYKEGDRVRIKSLDWYNENKDEDDNVVCFYSYFDKGMSEFCNKIVTIKALHGCHNVKAFRIIEDDGYSWWSDDMIEGLVEEETKPLTYEETVEIIEAMQGIGDSLECPQGYQFVDENGNVINATKIVLEKKKKEYPKTYEECKYILGITNPMIRPDYNGDLIVAFQKLLICRDAYWRLYGEEKGLGKPWEPDWINEHQVKYTIYTMGNDIIRHVGNYIHAILSFPTAEMRDAFKENFDADLEFCKELL